MNMSPAISSISSMFAASTFYAKSHPGDTCGTNGLPLTLNSIAIFGKAQFLKSLNHPNLCRYLDFIRSKHERLIVVSEYNGTTVEEKFHMIKCNQQTILRIFHQIATALNFLDSTYDFVVHNLEPKHILLDELNNVKIYNYGLFNMTNSGEHVSFPIGNLRYFSPERILGSTRNIKSDVWSLGIMMAELFLDFRFCENWKLSNTMRKILSFQGCVNILEKIARDVDRSSEYENLPTDVRNLLEKCLAVNLKDRFLPEDIVDHETFRENHEFYLHTNPPKSKENLLNLPLDQIYYLWMLAGGDVHAELKKERLIRCEPPILLIPNVVRLDGKDLGAKKSQSYLYDDRIAILSLNNLKERLKKIPPLRYFPLIHTPSCPYTYNNGMEKLPLVIRERDTEYQFHRILLFDRMLKGYPSTRDMIIKEAQTDIPPFLRGKIWACILDVIPNGSYTLIDKVTPTQTDRQIEVDVPRCHQYDEYLSSPDGHRKLKRLLKAWVTAHPQYVYWQGLDSLTAPFLYLNFNDEELAFLSLYKFVPKYLQWFFLKDNSAVIKEYLSKFAQLTAYHEPVLSTHLVGINFIPELFAIPWFLTMFSHVFPLHKILHLWDKLMLGDNSYPLFIGISILKQLRSTLLSSGFNECILLFSDLPDIVMENCVVQSQEMFESTPKSLSHREHILREEKAGEWDIADVTLDQIQSELCPRISAYDFVELLRYSPEKLCSVDLRGALEFSRLYIEGSINIPFTSVSLSEKNLESLGIPDLNKILDDRIIVVYSNLHENCILFSKFLVECGVPKVCVLHNGFDILHTIVPNILISK